MTVSVETFGPAAVFRFCPACGHEEPSIRASRELRCGACGLRFYFNAAAAAGAFVFHGGELILCVRSKPPALGMFDVPGGFIDFGESCEEGLRREIREELNIEVGELRLLYSGSNDYTYADVTYKTLDFFFMTETADISGIKPADDVGDFVLMDPRKLDPARLAFVTTRGAFAALMETLERSSPESSPKSV